MYSDVLPMKEIMPLFSITFLKLYLKYRDEMYQRWNRTEAKKTNNHDNEKIEKRKVNT